MNKKAETSFVFILVLIISVLIGWRYGFEKGITIFVIYIAIKLIKNLFRK